MALIDNLGRETYRVIKRAGLDVKQISYIFTSTGRIPLATFDERAFNTNYDAESGWVQIEPSLTIIFLAKGSRKPIAWFTRAHCNGVEGWRVTRTPKIPEFYLTEVDSLQGEAPLRPTTDTAWLADLERELRRTHILTEEEKRIEAQHNY